MVKVSRHFKTVLLVVDGLHEIHETHREVINLLELLRGTSTSIKILLSGRSDVNIAHLLKMLFEFHINLQCLPITIR
jgi:hypothetical protein